MEPNMNDSVPQQNPAVATASSSMTKPVLVVGGIVAILVIAGIFLWNQPAQGTAMNTSGTNTPIAEESWMPATTSSSDDAAAIQADLQATNMNDFGSMMNTDAQAATTNN